MSGFVFYDENANGVADPDEVVRLPGVTVTIGGRTAGSTAGGRFTVDDVPSGQRSASVRPDSLPAYFSPGAAAAVAVPPTADVAVPAVLALGTRRRPNVYLAYGDSITSGDGSDVGGYPDTLVRDLRAYWGKAEIINAGAPGTKSQVGASEIAGELGTHRPAYVLIMYGTNDWNEPACRDSRFPCFTIDSLRAMVQDTRSSGAHPVLATIPPVNPSWLDRPHEDRNDWVRRMNELVRNLARQERAPLADVHADFMRQPSLPPLYTDYLHPNDVGYAVIARSFLRAITSPLTSSSSGVRLLLTPPRGGPTEAR